MKKAKLVDLIFPVFITLVGLLSAWISPEDRFITITLVVFAVAVYFLSDIYGKLEEKDEKLQIQEKEIKRLNEKIKIHKDLIDIKVDILSLKKKRKK